MIKSKELLFDRRVNTLRPFKHKRHCRFHEGKLLIGYGTQHRTKTARLWRLRLRLKLLVGSPWMQQSPLDRITA